MAEAEGEQLMAQTMLVRTYGSEKAYQKDAQELAGYGFRPTSVTALPENRGGLYRILLLLCVLSGGLVVQMPTRTTLAVTYEQTRLTP
jgi:hypothetical protein